MFLKFSRAPTFWLIMEMATNSSFSYFDEGNVVLYSKLLVTPTYIKAKIDNKRIITINK